MNTSYKALRNRAQQSDNYWIESAKIDVVIELTRLMNRRGFSYARLAEKLNKSPAYISKVFNGEENLTIESMVKLARALDGKLHIHFADNGCEVKWFDVIKGRRHIDGTHQNAAESFQNPGERLKFNDDICQDEYAAA